MQVRLSNRQSEIPIRVRPLQRQLKSSLSLLPGQLPAELEAIEIVLVDRATMAAVHADFLGDPTETDVITFPYGEILVCPAVAKDQAPGHGLTVEHEILLYALHGILHLVGYDDVTPAKSRRMKQAQEELLKRVLKSSDKKLRHPELVEGSASGGFSQSKPNFKLAHALETDPSTSSG